MHKKFMFRENYACLESLMRGVGENQFALAPIADRTDDVRSGFQKQQCSAHCSAVPLTMTLASALRTGTRLFFIFDSSFFFFLLLYNDHQHALVRSPLFGHVDIL